MASPDSLRDLIAAAVAFRDERDWAQFHTAKELAISLSVESNELLQLLQWWKPEDLDRVIAEKHDKLRDELADVLFSVLLLGRLQCRLQFRNQFGLGGESVGQLAVLLAELLELSLVLLHLH